MTPLRPLRFDSLIFRPPSQLGVRVVVPESDGRLRIRRALLSVANKLELVPFARGLAGHFHRTPRDRWDARRDPRSRRSVPGRRRSSRGSARGSTVGSRPSTPDCSAGYSPRARRTETGSWLLMDSCGSIWWPSTSILSNSIWLSIRPRRIGRSSSILAASRSPAPPRRITRRCWS